MNLIKPKPLKKGDTIAFLTASGPVYEIERVERAKKYFENLGFEVVLSKTTYSKPKDFLAADDKHRAAELNCLFADEGIDAIFCTRGGYGAIRILDKIDYKIVADCPKIFCGFSDATAFLAAFYAKTGLMPYHAPMPYPDFGGESVSKITEKSFLSMLEGNPFTADLSEGCVYRKGTASGILWGGNLATLASMVGLDFVPEEKFILFIEDVNEPAYKIDRYLTQLMFDKKFKKNMAGIVLGAFTGLDEQEFFDNIFREIGKNLKIPVASGLKIGHVRDKITVPIGVSAIFDTQEHKIFEVV